MGLVDKLVDEDKLSEEAIAFARAQSDTRRTGDMNANADVDIFERFATENARAIGRLEAPLSWI